MMKTYHHLYEKIASYENLLAAALRAARGKRSWPNVAEFLADLGGNVLRLHRELQGESWTPGEYRAFWIREPKPRLISAAPFRDRVVHHAICNVIEPLFEPTFIFDSYACRVGKGTHAAVDRYTAFSRRHELVVANSFALHPARRAANEFATTRHRYVLKCDLQKFFPSIDHAILLDLLTRKIGCRRTSGLLRLVVESSNPQEPSHHYFPGDNLFTPYERRRGIPIGNLTSQFFADVYLNPFDHFVKEELRCPGYIRYCDDFVIFGDDKRHLARLVGDLATALARLRLKLHERKCRVYRVEEGLDFLGYRVWPTRRRLRRASVLRFTWRRQKLSQAWRAGETDLGHVRASMASWVGHAGHADTWRLREALARGFVW